MANMFSLFARELGRIYADAEAMVHDQGAMATSAMGVGAVVSAMHEAFTGRDLMIEITGAAATVEWAAVLGATVFPYVSSGYSESVASELVASVYSGVRDDSTAPIANNLLEALGGVLSIDNDAPIDEFIHGFGGGEIDRLRQLIVGLAS